MSELTPEQGAAIEANLGRYQAAPMPPELNELVKDLIVPHTMNMELKHGDVMECIHVAFPVIRDWLHAHPDDAVPR
jgi:hypothetical protein